MAKTTTRTHATLFCVLVITACAEGIPSAADKDPLLDGDAGSSSGSSGQLAHAGSSSGAGVTAGSGASDEGGSVNAGGSPSAGSPSSGVSGSAPLMGGAPGSAGASAMGGTTSAGGSPTAGASSGGKGGMPAGGSAGSMAGGSSAGSGGSAAAPCSGAKPESNCVCHTNSNHDYWFCPTARSFDDGESKCVVAGLHMVKITSAAEDKWVNDTANAASFGEYYLGSTDANTPNTWTWLAGGTFWTGVANGTASGYAHWNTGEPNASGDCLVMQSNYVWDDRICTDQRTYICE